MINFKVVSFTDIDHQGEKQKKKMPPLVKLISAQLRIALNNFFAKIKPPGLTIMIWCFNGRKNYERI